MDDFMIVYIEDILVYSKTAEDHAQLFEYANRQKYIFARQKIEFLGYLVTRDRNNPDIRKVKAIQ